MPLDQSATLDPLAALQRSLDAIAARAGARDQDLAFPVEDVAALADAGLLVAPLIPAEGGIGLGTTLAGAAPAILALRRIGRASLVLGRLYEGHVNALRLIARHGRDTQRRGAAQDARDGELFAVWNTDAPGEPPLRLVVEGDALRLFGRKALCSGAGSIRRALVTALVGDVPQLVLVPLADDVRSDRSRWTAQGMRASATGDVDFTGLVLPLGALIGAPGAYHAPPDFAAGAWRFAAVQAGGVEALAEALRQHHRRTGRGGDPLQAARFGEVALAVETARLWVEAAAMQAEAASVGDAEHVTALVNLARTAVERAAMQAIALTQRSIGLQALMRPHDAERIARDLATYLRQPAPDRALAQAAAHILGAADPIGELWGAL